MQIYFLERYKVITPFGSKIFFHNPWNNQETHGFLMFLGGIENEHLPHFLMSLKENIGWPEKICVSANTNYIFNWKLFLPYDLLQATI